MGILALGPAAQASTADTGYITNVSTNSYGAVGFTHTGVRSAMPACQSAATTKWVFSANDAQGQAKLAMLLTAYALHKPVVVWGRGSCNEWGDTESVEVLFVN